MANSNFVVQNGLTAGPTNIFTGNGDVITTGNVVINGVIVPNLSTMLTYNLAF